MDKCSLNLKSLAVVLLTLCLLIAVESKSRKGSLSGDSCPLRNKFYPTSCLDYLKKGVTKCDVYQIYDNSGNSFPVYCDMKSEPGNAWTLVMSWSNENREYVTGRPKTFLQDSPVHENAPNFQLYRLTHARMNAIKNQSTHWRATCGYPTHPVDYRDYVRGTFKDLDVMTFTGVGVCKKVEYVNIRGHVGIHVTARWWQQDRQPHTWSLHIDSSAKGCEFVPVQGAVLYEDNFGHHVTRNPKFRCTANDKATTQWWFGGHL